MLPDMSEFTAKRVAKRSVSLSPSRGGAPDDVLLLDSSNSRRIDSSVAPEPQSAVDAGRRRNSYFLEADNRHRANRFLLKKMRTGRGFRRGLG